MRKKGSPKTGGRVKGTPNKVTHFEKELISEILSNYHQSGKLSSDFDAVDPEKRLDIAVRLAAYVIPKPQAVSLDIANNTLASLDRLLRDLAGE